MLSTTPATIPCMENKNEWVKRSPRTGLPVDPELFIWQWIKLWAADFCRLPRYVDKHKYINRLYSNLLIRANGTLFEILTLFQIMTNFGLNESTSFF